MNYSLRYLFILIWIAYLICSGVYLFARGFLLSRIAKQDVNTCKHIPENWKDVNHLSQKSFSESICAPRKSKIILIVIDALKYDFGIYNETKKNPLPYENKISIFHELLTNKSEHSRIFKFHADPPTTTLQRLKGLTTGSLPTFIDIGSNFATSEINEDNIIDQIINNHLSTVFLGDDTWTSLYPKRFKRHYSYSSFNIYDLDTVDMEILKNLPNELEKIDWNVLVAHFLGVDHCGHRYGPLHNEMSRKLNEMDQMIRMVIEKMDHETTLFVIGDHGMTITGDHGGESEDEVNALLFAYSKGHKFFKVNDQRYNFEMNQIDLVPTLSTILGIPIPYSNLGKINFNLIPNIDNSIPKYKLLQLHAWQNIQQIYNYFTNYAKKNKNLNDLLKNIERKFKNIKDKIIKIKSEDDFKIFHNEFNKFMIEILEIFHNIWIKFDINQIIHGLLCTISPIIFTFLLINQTNDVLKFSKIFTTQIIGFIYFLNVTGAILAYFYFKELSMKTEEHSIILITSLISTFIFIILTLKNWTYVLKTLNWKNNMKILISNLPTQLIFIISGFVFFSNSFIIQEQKILSYLLTTLILIIIYEIIKESIFYDNKFMTAPQKIKIMTFLKMNSFKLILLGGFAIIILRCSHQFFRCREEQINCEDLTLFIVNNSSSTTTVAAGNNLKLKINFVSILILILYTISTRIYLRSCGNLTGYSINILLARYGTIISSVCASCYILLINSNLKHRNLSQYTDRMAWIVYGLFIIQLFIIFIYPLMIYVIMPKKHNDKLQIINSSKFLNNTDIVPEIFEKMKQAYYEKQQHNEKILNDKKLIENKQQEIPIVYGLATIYSSTIISFGNFLLSFLVILLDGRPSLGLFICIFVGIAVLIMHSFLRYRKAAYKLASCTQPTFTVIVIWLLLGHFTFFATSHQTTLSQIEWRAAFVGRTTNYDNSNFISGFLVITNTFAGQILFMILYSLLTSEIFSIMALFPKLIIRQIPILTASSSSKKKINNKTNLILNNDQITEGRLFLTDENDEQIKSNSTEFEISKGELILYENDNIYIGSLFKLACQFFVLQGLRIFFSMIACVIHSRHLMVWKIFAPRFIYEAISTLISFPALIFGYLIVIRLHWSVNRLINQINKTK